MQVVDHGSGKLLGEAPRIALVLLVESLQVSIAVALEDDRGWEAEPNEDQVQE